MSLSTKLVAVLALPVAVLLGTVGLALFSQHRSNETLQAVEHTFDVKRGIAAVLTDLVDAETGMRGYLLTGRAQYLGPYDESTVRLPRDLAGLTELARDNASQVARIHQLNTLVADRLTILAQLRPLAPIKNGADRREVVSKMAEGTTLMKRVRSVLGAMDDEESDLLAERTQRLHQARHMSFLVGVIGAPAGMFVALLVVMLLARRILRRIRRIEENALRLDQGLPLLDAGDHNDEIGNLARTVALSGTRVIELQGALRRLATIDPLTRLVNRRGFLPLAEHELAVAQRTHQSMAVMFMDLDGLKAVNDELGHIAGDGMITEAAYLIRTTFRASDIAARVGGDEFCVLFAAESQEAASAAVARLEDAVVNANAEPGRAFTLSLSTGIAWFDPETPTSLERLLAEADGRMYERKREKQSSTPSRV